MKRLFIFALLAVLSLQSLAQVDFRKETIYFLLTTRFFDGDTTNDVPTEWCSYTDGKSNNITDPKDVTWRGDFKGLIQKLDYIKGMGFTAIWITPVVQNRSPLDYHGYHGWDFTKVDPRLESPGATFQDLINAVHAKGMKLVLDIVTNHACRYGLKDSAELKYNTDPNQVWGKDKDGNALKDNPDWTYDGLTPNSLDNKIWSRSNLAKMAAPYNQNLAAYNFPGTESFVNTSDEKWFHHSGNGFVQGWDDTTNCYQRAISDDCPDLNTGSQSVRDYMFNAYKKFIDMGVDAFRWDTWKHMNKGDIIYLLDKFKQVNPNLFVFGEVAQKRFELHPVLELNPHWYTWRGDVGTSSPLNAGVLDFFAEATFHNIFENGGAFSGVTDCARYDNLYGDASLLVTWLDNHDFGPNNDWNRRYGGSPENLAACMNFMFTWRGIPSVYYGTEIQFMKGAYTDLNSPNSINESLNVTGRAYYGEQIATAPNNKLYAHFKKLNDIRKAIPALQSGTWNWGGNYPGNGIGYTRKLGDQTVAVGLAKDGDASFSFSGVTNGIYRDAVTGKEVNVTNGTLAFTVKSVSAGIYVLNGPGMIGESGAGYFEPCVNGCVAAPKLTINPVGDNYDSPVTVTMTATGGTAPVKIYYTTDGSNPTALSKLYTASFVVDTATTVKAIAIDANTKQSDMQGERYTFVLPSPAVSITPAAGNYYDPISVSMSAAKGKAPYSIYYTTDGSNPTTSSAKYTNPFTVSTALVVKSLAVDASNQSSAIKSNSYTFNIPAPIVTASPAGGNFYLGSVKVALNASTPRPPAIIYYTTDGSTPTASSAVYADSIAFAGPDAKTLKYFATDNEGRSSAVDSQKYTFNPIPDMYVYIQKPAEWKTPVKIHYWNALPEGSVANTTWPGLNMTQVCSNSNWWVYKFSGVSSINIVFNDGAGKQTADLFANKNSYYSNGAWLAIIPDVEAPIAKLVATPASGIAPLTVNFDASSSSACSQLNYAWDFGNGNTELTEINPKTSQVYANPGIYTAQLIAQDANGKADTVQQNITVTNATSGMIIHFKRPANWTNIPHLYFWNTVPVTITTTWPGVAMEEEGDGWWKYTLNGVECSNIIFNNNGQPQTADLYKCGECWYDNGWVDDPLPIRISQLRGMLSNNIATLQWIALQEINISRYEIERSIDGISFTGIATIAAAGTGSKHDYTFTDDKLPGTARWYYRLRIAENNGSNSYSNIVALRTNAVAVSFYPNPAKQNLYMQTGNLAAGKYILQFTDITGKKIWQTTLSIQANQTMPVIFNRRITQGVYLAQLVNSKGMIAAAKIIFEE